MTLDGHVKTGMAATLLASVAIPSFFPSVSGVVLSLTLFFLFLGNVGPDFSEMGLIRHRTHTHYHIYYWVIAGGTYFIMTQKLLDPVWAWSIIGYCVGCLMHILCDIPYGKIPYFSPGKPKTLMRVPFDSVFNRVIEYTVVAALFLAFLLWDVDIQSWFNQISPTDAFPSASN